jgi:hypothetical protein
MSMSASGTTQIRNKSSLLATRVLLAILVAWGAIGEMTAPLLVPFRLSPGTIAKLYPGTKYTSVTWKFEQRGWPFVFSIRTNLPERAPGPRNDDYPFGLACDFSFVGMLVFAVWSMLRRWRWQFGLADILGIMASLAIMIAFHVRVWDHALDCSKIAVDLGVFSAALAAIRLLQKLPAYRCGEYTSSASL